MGKVIDLGYGYLVALYPRIVLLNFALPLSLYIYLYRPFDALNGPSSRVLLLLLVVIWRWRENDHAGNLMIL